MRPSRRSGPSSTLLSRRSRSAPTTRSTWVARSPSSTACRSTASPSSTAPRACRRPGSPSGPSPTTPPPAACGPSSSTAPSSTSVATSPPCRHCGQPSCNRGKVARFNIGSAADASRRVPGLPGRWRQGAGPRGRPDQRHAGCTSEASSAGPAPAPAPRPIAGTGFLAAFRQDNAALVQTWVPGLTPPPPGPGGVVRDPEVRGLAAFGGVVYAGVGGGGGRFYVLNSAAGAAPALPPHLQHRRRRPGRGHHAPG